MICSIAERIVCHAVCGVVIVVIACGDGTTSALDLANRPVLKVVAAAIDQADLIIATVAEKSAHVFAATAGIVCSVVLKNLSRH